MHVCGRVFCWLVTLLIFTATFGSPSNANSIVERHVFTKSFVSAAATDPTGCDLSANLSISPWRQAPYGQGKIFDDVPKGGNAFTTLPVLYCNQHYEPSAIDGCGVGATFPKCQDYYQNTDQTCSVFYTCNPYAPAHYLYQTGQTKDDVTLGCSWQIMFSFPGQALIEDWFNLLAEDTAESVFTVLKNNTRALNLQKVVDIREVSQTALYTIHADESKYFVGQMAVGTDFACPHKSPLPQRGPVGNLPKKQINADQSQANYIFEYSVYLSMLANQVSAGWLEDGGWTYHLGNYAHNNEARLITNIVANALSYLFASLWNTSAPTGTLTANAVAYAKKNMEPLFIALVNNKAFTVDDLEDVAYILYSAVPPKTFPSGISNRDYAYMLYQQLQNQVEYIAAKPSVQTNWNLTFPMVIKGVLTDMEMEFCSAAREKNKGLKPCFALGSSIKDPPVLLP